MEETLRAHLLQLASAYSTKTGQSYATIGKRALNDNTFFARFEAGDVGFNIRTFDKVVQWFADNWPADAEWPADVPRPEPTPEPSEAPVTEPDFRSRLRLLS